jgi:hypothetical protein
VQSITVIADIEGFTLEMMRSQLEFDRGKPLPKRTLYFWINACGIERDSDGFYATEDLQALQALVIWLKRPGASIERFKQRLSQWRKEHAYQ